MSQPGTGAWLFATPNPAYGQVMTPIEFRAALALRLMVPLFPEGSKCQLCGKNMDVYGYHAMACSKNRYLSRHNLVQDALYDIAYNAQLRPESDAHVGCLGLTQRGSTRILRPADLLIDGHGFPRTCIDVTVVSPLCASAFRLGQSVGAAAQKAEDAKYVKHRDACYASRYGFKAFAVDSLGVLAKGSIDLLERLSKLVAHGRGWKPSLARKICRGRIGFAVARSVARQYVACKIEGVFM